jgi:hypothetical protein
MKERNERLSQQRDRDREIEQLRQQQAASTVPIGNDRVCMYCAKVFTEPPLEYKGQTFDVCEGCRSTPRRIQEENGHLILMDSIEDTRTCLICGASQRFTPDGDIEGVRFNITHCKEV